MRGRMSVIAAWAFSTMVLLLGGSATAFGGALDEPKAEGTPRVRVVASIAPLAGLVSPMLESAKIPASVETIVPPGVSEHGYEVPPSKLSALAGADVVVIVGLGMEPQIEKFLKDRPNPRRRVVVVAEAAGVGGKGGEHDRAHDHEHDHDHKHGEGCNHGPVDPHVWLDPGLVEKIVPEIGKALRGALADDGGAVMRLRAAEEEMLTRVRGVDAEYRAMVGRARTKTVVVGHDAWGYLEKRYGIEAVAIKGLTASEPTPTSLENAVKAIKEGGARAVLVEPQLSRQAGEKIAKATGVPVRVIDPLGDGDWFAMMRGNLKEFGAAMGVEESVIEPK